MGPQFDCRDRVAGGRIPYGFVTDFVASVHGSGKLTFSVSDIALQTGVVVTNLQTALPSHLRLALYKDIAQSRLLRHRVTGIIPGALSNVAFRLSGSWRWKGKPDIAHHAKLADACNRVGETDGF
jgi:lipoprotein signal peptidase